MKSSGTAGDVDTLRQPMALAARGVAGGCRRRAGRGIERQSNNEGERKKKGRRRKPTAALTEVS